MKGIGRFLAALAFTLLVPLASAQTLALTFDDGLNPETEPAAAQWNGAILAALKNAGVQAMVFPSLNNTGRGAGLELIRAWSANGHAVGNHTSKHRSLGSTRVPLAEFIDEVKEADAVLRTMPTWAPMLRFPFLKEGDTAQKRDGMRAWMKANGYRPAPVSIDTSDWYFNRVYLALSKANDSERALKVQEQYVEHLLDRAAYYDKLGRSVLGRSPPHVMLLHVNAINAATLPKVIEAFRKQGWKMVSPAQAFADPLYSSEPGALPAGESIVWAHAKGAGVAGLRYPAEDSVYEEPALRALGLTP